MSAPRRCRSRAIRRGLRPSGPHSDGRASPRQSPIGGRNDLKSRDLRREDLGHGLPHLWPQLGAESSKCVPPSPPVYALARCARSWLRLAAPTCEPRSDLVRRGRRHEPEPSASATVHGRDRRAGLLRLAAPPCRRVSERSGDRAVATCGVGGRTHGLGSFSEGLHVTA